jgi:hypothetical protein
MQDGLLEIDVIATDIIPLSTKECNYGIYVGQTYSSLTKSKVNSIYTYNFK